MIIGPRCILHLKRISGRPQGAKLGCAGGYLLNGTKFRVGGLLLIAYPPARIGKYIIPGVYFVSPERLTQALQPHSHATKPSACLTIAICTMRINRRRFTVLSTKVTA